MYKTQRKHQQVMYEKHMNFFHALKFICQQTVNFYFIFTQKKFIMQQINCFSVSHSPKQTNKQTSLVLHCSQERVKNQHSTAKLNFKLNNNYYIRYQVSNETKIEQALQIDIV